MFDAGFSLTCPLRLEETLERLGRIIHPDPGLAGRLARTLTVTEPQPLWFWGSLGRGGFRCFRAHLPMWGGRSTWPHPWVEGQLLEVERGTQVFVRVRPRLPHRLVLAQPAVVLLAWFAVGDRSPGGLLVALVPVAALGAWGTFLTRERVLHEARAVREELQRLLLA